MRAKARQAILCMGTDGSETNGSNEMRAMGPCFVGREEEIEQFKALLAPSAVKRVLFISGPAGIGKSALINQMIVRCEAENTPYFDFDFRMSNIEPSSLAILRLLIRNKKSTTPQTLLKDIDRTIVELELLYSRAYQSIESQRSREKQRAPSESIMLPVSRASTYRVERRRLTHEFIRNFGDLSLQKVVVCFLDSFEVAGQAIADWLWDELIPGLITKGRSQLRFVIMGREPPRPEDISEVEAETGVRQLGPLNDESCKQYLISCLGLSLDDARLSQILKIIAGNPLSLALHGLALQQAR